jgi:hypothetical protein
MEGPAKPVAKLAAVLHSAWEVAAANLPQIVVLTLVVNAPINAVLELVPIPEEGGLEEWGRYFRVARALQFWIGTIGILGVVHITVAAHRGARLSIGQAFGRSFRSYGSALWAEFIYGAAFVLGLVLLVVPGVVIGVLWYFSLQAIVAHHMSGWQALKHSQQVVEGRWWAFFGRVTALYVLMVLGMGVLSVPFLFLPESFFFGMISMIPVDLMTSFFTVCFTQLYLMSGPEVERPPLGDVIP